MKIDYSQVTVSAVSADLINYKLTLGGNYYIGASRYFEYGGNGYVIFYDYPEIAGSAIKQKAETVVSTFKLGG